MTNYDNKNMDELYNVCTYSSYFILRTFAHSLLGPFLDFMAVFLGFLGPVCGNILGYKPHSYSYIHTYIYN